MQRVNKMEWRPLKLHQNPQMRTTAEEEYKKEMQRIELKRKQMEEVENRRHKKYFDPNLDKKKKWDEMNQELNQERQVRGYLVTLELRKKASP